MPAARQRRSTKAELAAAEVEPDDTDLDEAEESDELFALDLTAELAQTKTFFVQTTPDGDGFNMLANYWPPAVFSKPRWTTTSAGWSGCSLRRCLKLTPRCSSRCRWARWRRFFSITSSP